MIKFKDRYVILSGMNNKEISSKYPLLYDNSKYIFESETKLKYKYFIIDVIQMITVGALEKLTTPQCISNISNDMFIDQRLNEFKTLNKKHFDIYKSTNLEYKNSLDDIYSNYESMKDYKKSLKSIDIKDVYMSGNTWGMITYNTENYVMKRNKKNKIVSTIIKKESFLINRKEILKIEDYFKRSNKIKRYLDI